LVTGGATAVLFKVDKPPAVEVSAPVVACVKAPVFAVLAKFPVIGGLLVVDKPPVFAVPVVA
jgi:hypothetical protein